MWLKGTAAASLPLTTRVLEMKHRCPRVISYFFCQRILIKTGHHRTPTLDVPRSPKEDLAIRSVPVPFDGYHLISACVVKFDTVAGELGASAPFLSPVAYLDR